MIAFIDTYRDRFGIELICRTLGATDGGFITARGYRAAKTRPPSARTISDRLLVEEISTIHRNNYGVYGVRKMHAAMRRAGWRIGRDRTARLMRLAGVAGARRGAQVFTTHPDLAAARPADLVDRHFRADAPNRLWVVDMTYVRTRPGFVYTAFVTDVCTRTIVGWAVRSTMHTQLPLDAFNDAVWQANTSLEQLTHHSDRGSQYVSISYTDRLQQLGVTPSVGSRGDSYDNALAESVNAAYKTECINPGRPWLTVDDVKYATMIWVHWFNNQRLHQSLNYRTPAEIETEYKTPRAATAALAD